MFGIGGNEILIILLFAFLIFGPDKLPKAGKTIGRVIRQFRNAQDEMNRVIKTEVYDPLTDTDPLRNPFDSKKGAKRTSNSASSVEGEETFAQRKARMTAEKEAARKAREQAFSAKTSASVLKTASNADTTSGTSFAVNSGDAATAAANSPTTFSQRRAAAVAQAKAAPASSTSTLGEEGEQQA